MLTEGWASCVEDGECKYGGVLVVWEGEGGDGWRMAVSGRLGLDGCVVCLANERTTHALLTLLRASQQ